MRLVVVHEKYWLAILRKDKLIEFRSSNHAILLNACQCLLFALPMRHRRNGKGALICARVLSAELLDVDQACAAFPREAEDCNLTDLAARWGVTFVRCIALDKDSIRIAARSRTFPWDARASFINLRSKQACHTFATRAI